MSDVQQPTTNQDDERRLFELLDRYVETLHREDLQTRSALLERHGELADLLACLDSLEDLAPPAAGGPERAARSGADSNSTGLRPGNVAGEMSSDSAQHPQAGLPVDFGKYELLAEVGRGGMGVVYRARQKDLDRTVAVKMILANWLAAPETVQRFYAEARAAGGIKHPNIIGIHEVGQIHGQHYFAMDYVEGRGLGELTQNGPLDGETAAKLVASVARAVQHLHEHGIIHRDLKPSNILVDAEGLPYVTDFALAKVFNSENAQTRTGTILGTPSYMSPEQAAGRTAEISAQSDVYSLGAILYELLCGRPPFKEETPLDTLVQVLEGEPPVLSRLNRSVPRDLELICLRCLEKNPQQRYPSAAVLADDLERFLKREPIQARPSGLDQKLHRWVRREPALVSRLSGFLIAAAIAQTAYLLDPVDLDYHLRIMSIIGIWAAVSFLFQHMLHRESLADFTRFAWSATDAILLTLLLAVTKGPLGPLVIGYPLLVAAAGLFFRVRLVWFMTISCLVSYSVLLLVHPEEARPPHYPVIFAAVLAVLGFIVAYQVYRVRVLSRFYNRHRLP